MSISAWGKFYLPIIFFICSIIYFPISWFHLLKLLQVNHLLNLPQVWRDLQFQHIYNLSQRLMRQLGRSRTFYAGALYFDSSVRSFGLSDILIGSVAQICSNSNSLLMTQSNFRGFDQFVEGNFKNPQIVEAIRYDDEELVLPTNVDDDKQEKCFKLLSKLDGIRFYADFGDSKC